MISKVFKVTSENGIHARPATTLVNTAMHFDSEIMITALKKTVDFKSIMGFMSLGIYNGTIVEISCSGADENEALDAITQKIIELKLGKEM